MLSHASTRGLLWKETRQILPLIAIVIGVGILVLVVGTIVSSLSRQTANFGSAIVWVLPACYAVGAAALLVGQEKEQRTITWLSSLPSHPSRVIAIKFLVVTTGLLAMWIIAGLLILVTGNLDSGLVRNPIRSATGFMGPMGVFGPELFLQSIVILVCGFYAAWKTESTFAGLVLLVPLACAPLLFYHLFSAAHGWITGMRIVPPELATFVMYAGLVLWIILFAWLSVRAAGRYLSPRLATSTADLDSQRLLDAWRPTVATAPDEPFHRPLSALIWQTVDHHRWAMLLVLAVLLVGAFGTSFFGQTPYSDSSRSNFEGYGLFAAAIAALSVSWLGVMTFAGDGSAARLRFLADRGVSPGRVWFGRQIVAVSLLSIAVLAYALFSSWAIITSNEYNTVVSVAVIAIGVWTIYSVSQWISQSLQLLAGAVVIAPIVSVAVLAWAGYAMSSLGAPIWLLLLCSVIPMMATRLMMRRYMDGRRDWVSLISVLSVILSAVILPAVPCAIHIATAPDISPQQRQRMLAEVAQIERVHAVFIYPGSSAGSPSWMNSTSEEMLERYQTAEFGPRKPFIPNGEASDQNHALTTDSFFHLGVIQSANHARVAFESNSGDAGVADQLSKWINEVIRWGTGLRRSQKLADQLAADLMEIWLVDALRSESIRNLDNIDRTAATKLLGDHSFRSQARRNAVLMSWNQSMTRDVKQGQISSLGGSYVPDVDAIAWLLTYQRFINRFAAALIDLIDAGSEGKSTTDQRSKLAGLVEDFDWDSIHDPYADHWRDTVTLADIYAGSAREGIYQVGALWYAPWEQEAGELAQELAQEPTLKTGSDSNSDAEEQE